MTPQPPSSTLFPYTTLFRSKQHDQRAAQSPAWKLMLDELAQYKKMRDMTTISLNLATREAERKQQEQMQAARFSEDRKSTRLNSSHMSISYAVFCLKKKNNQ